MIEKKLVDFFFRSIFFDQKNFGQKVFSTKCFFDQFFFTKKIRSKKSDRFFFDRNNFDQFFSTKLFFHLVCFEKNQRDEYKLYHGEQPINCFIASNNCEDTAYLVLLRVEVMFLAPSPPPSLPYTTPTHPPSPSPRRNFLFFPKCLQLPVN